ncbi:MAG: peptide chain release factor N(5)-glutamine methyltransferase [bacterium]
MILKIILKEELKKGAEYLLHAGIKHYQLESEILLSHILEVSREKLHIRDEADILDEKYAKWMSVLAERKKLRPIAYLLGKKEFMSMDFFVDENVLIPRPETEFLVEKVQELARDKRNFPWWIIDLGAGSGNIAVSLLKHLNEGLVFATDISGDALKVAKKNAEKHNVENRIVFFEGCWFLPFEGKNLEGKMDFIVSNPPYLTRVEMDSITPDVGYEPKKALYGGEDGLRFYPGIINGALKFLKPGGYLILEIGVEHKEKILNLIDNGGYDKPEVIKDYSGFDRVIAVRKTV